MATQKAIVRAMNLEHDVERATKLLEALVNEGLILRAGARFTLP
jgi:hypothetical protein